MALLPEYTPNIVVVIVGNELRKERIMNGTTTIVTDVSHDVHDRIQMCTTAEAARLLEELRAAYQRLGLEQRQQIKSLLLKFSKNENSPKNTVAFAEPNAEVFH
jgi:hypothetical protein